MKVKKGIISIIILVFLLSGCEGLSEGSIQLQRENDISEKLMELADGYRDIYEEMVNEDSFDSISAMERIVDYVGMYGYAVVDEWNQLDMQNFEQIERFCDKAADGKIATTEIVVVKNNGGLHHYGLCAGNGDFMVTETIISWEDGEPAISYTHSYEAYTWKYTESGYLFFEEYYPEGYDGAPAQVGIRVKYLDQTYRELNRKYVLSPGYERNNLLITDWKNGDFEGIDFYDLYERFYEMKYHTDVPYEESVTCVEYEIPEKEFEEILQTYLDIEASVLRQYTDFHETTKSYQYRPRTMYDAIMAYGPYPEVIDYEELSNGAIKLLVNGVWTRKMDDRAWLSELVVQPLEDGGFQYISNTVISVSEGIDFKNHDISAQDIESEMDTEEGVSTDLKYSAPWYTPRLTDSEWEAYATQADLSLAVTESKSYGNVDENDLAENQAELYIESGYDIPISEQVKEAAEEDCLMVMEMIKELYLNADKGTAVNALLTRDTAIQMIKRIADTGKISMAGGYNLNMENYEAVHTFLSNAQNGQSGTVTIYDLHSRGGVDRKEFTFDGSDMYLLGTTAVWNAKQMAVINHTTYHRLENWKYTEKGWFIYEYCLPEMSDRINGNDMFRVKPLDGSLREICEKYLMPISYQGNNLLFSNWDADCMGELDYTGLFQYLYEIEHGEKFKSDTYKDGIPKEEFEAILTKYLPVRKEQLQQYVVYDAAADTYVWRSLGQISYRLNFFSTSVPEITSIRENMDGTTTLSVDAVCNLMGKDAVISHELTVQFTEDGGIRYLRNQILNNGVDMIPEYQYRMM